jgi:hypothetical protein
MRPHRGTGILFLIASVSMPCPVLAEQSDRESWRVVTMIESRGDEAAALRLSEAVEAQLSDLRVSFVVRRDALSGSRGAREIAERSLDEAPDALAAFWVSLEEERLYLAVSSEGGPMVLSRAIESSSLSTDAEIVGNILRASIQVLLDEEDGSEVLLQSETWELETTTESPQHSPEPPREVMPEAPREVVPEAPQRTDRTRRSQRVGLQVGYHLGVWSSTHPAVHGIALSLEVRIVRALRASFIYRVTVPIDAITDKVDLRLHPHPFTLSLSYGWERGRVSIEGGLALTLMALSQETRAQAPMVAAEDEGRVVVSLGPLVRVRVHLIGPLRFVSILGVSIFFRNHDYVIDEERERQLLIEMWRAQPYLLVGLSIGLF